MNDQRKTPGFDRLEQLVSAKCNGSLDEQGLQELNSLLEGSAELRNDYCSLIGFNTDLYWVLSRPHLPEISAQSATQAVGASAAASTVGHAGRSSWALASAAAVLLSVGLAAGLWPGKGIAPPPIAQDPAQPAEQTEPSPPPEPSPRAADPEEYAALLDSPSDASRWRNGPAGEANPAGLRYGETVLVDEGVIKIRLDKGAVGVLRAPAEMLLIASDRVRLVQGRLAMTAPKLTDGFTVETPSAEVVDLGTVFSVEAAEAGTDLVVFDGKVDLRVPRASAESDDSAPAAAVNLVQGEAVHVGADGNLSRISSVQSSPDPMDMSSTGRSFAIGTVADNSDSKENWRFYEIVSGGMREDARAYVDRFHEWNGVTADGLPSYLVGGDYIKMFNEDKALDDIQIEVTLSRPSTLYVLLDNRVAAPEWLEAGFVNTGDQIGVDESPHDTANRFPANDEFAQVGPGESIDRVHSIWKRVVPNGGPVTLGPNGKIPNRVRTDPRPHYIRANMYGIVAAPLTEAE